MAVAEWRERIAKKEATEAERRSQEMNPARAEREGRERMYWMGEKAAIRPNQATHREKKGRSEQSLKCGRALTKRGRH
jgi:hypothetical protein